MITGDYHYRKADGELVHIGWLHSDKTNLHFYWAIPVADILQIDSNRWTVIAPDGQEMTANNFLGVEVPWETTSWFTSSGLDNG